MDKKMCLSWTKKYFVPSVPFVDKKNRNKNSCLPCLSWTKFFRGKYLSWKKTFRAFRAFRGQNFFVEKNLSCLACLSWTKFFRGKKLSCLPCLSWTKFFAEKYLSWKKKPFVPFVPSVPFVDKKNRAFRGPISSVDKKQFLCSLAYFWPHP